MTQPENSKTFEHDYIIVGAGPAGLQLGYFFEKAGRNYLILEAGDTPGTFFKRYPRHRTLISSNKVYTGYDDPEVNMRFDWNSLIADDEELLFKNYSKRYFPPADELVRYLCDYADHYNLNVKYNTRVTHIAKEGQRFTLQDDAGNTYSALRVIIATGFTRPYLPDIPGIELTEPYTEMSTDPEEFVNQKVLIIGKGNSGFETADNLIETAAVIHIASPQPLNLAWKTHFVGHLRAVNNNFLDTYQLKTQNAVIDACVEKIERRDGKLAVTFNYSHANGEKEELLYDRVLACTGFRFDASVFDESARPNLVIKDRFPEQTCEWESTNVEGLYFAGTLTQMRDFKKTTSGFIHGFRYNVRALWHILERKHHGVEWPSYAVAATPEAIAEAFLERINKSSGLWQQFGFLCDLIVVSKDGTEARYYEELPVDYVKESSFGESEHYYTATLEFGKITGDPFNIERFPDTGQAERSTFLHPVIRHYAGSNFISEQHLLEDLGGEWRKKDLHVEPLTDFLRNQILTPA